MITIKTKTELLLVVVCLISLFISISIFVCHLNHPRRVVSGHNLPRSVSGEVWVDVSE